MNVRCGQLDLMVRLLLSSRGVQCDLHFPEDALLSVRLREHVAMERDLGVRLATDG